MGARPRPNVVLLYADDLGFGDLGCFGADDIPTPHLDSLAADGARLTQWYSNSPVCSPSRASLLTGKYPGRAGVESILGGRRGTPGLPPQPTLASQLRERGYRTGIVGKWHLGTGPEFAPQHYGFEESFGFRAGCVDYYSHIFYWGGHDPVHDLWDGDDEVWLNGQYLTTVIGQRAARFIGDHAGRDPFFCYVPFNAPHYPLHAPAEHMERVAQLSPGRRELAAMIAAMDDAVGEILSALEEAGERENTLVLFSSDNGPSRESRNWLGGEEISYDGGSTGGLRGSKGSVFEGGIRVPTIASWPGRIPAGTEHRTLGMMMDVLPTVLHAADGQTPQLPEVDGISQLEALQSAGVQPGGAQSAGAQPGGAQPAGAAEGAGPAATTSPPPGPAVAASPPPAAGERSVYWAYQGQWAIRRGRYKLVVGAREGMDPPAAVERALYDLEADPGESADLSAQAPQVVEALAGELVAARR